MSRFAGEISFVEEVERLKNITRTAWTSTGRRESTAEHSFRLALFFLVLKDYLPELDFFKAIAMCLVHDLGEAYVGDVSAALEPDSGVKATLERAGLERLVSALPEAGRKEILALFLEYAEGLTKEAKLVKALDKLETILQHNQGLNPKDFDYAFNLLYGKEYTDAVPLTKEIRESIDKKTREAIGRTSL